MSVTRTTILEASTLSTTPEFLATIQTPESLATTVSNPVPTSGFSALRTGTACRCMLDPIKALLASSCSRNGIKEAAIETTCCGDTSIKSILSGDINSNSFACLTATRSSTNLLFLSSITFAWAITCSASSIADKYIISSVTLPFVTFLYGVSIKPYWFVLEYDAKELINPIFGPSGVSIGQTLP